MTRFHEQVEALLSSKIGDELRKEKNFLARLRSVSSPAELSDEDLEKFSSYLRRARQ